MRVITKQAWQLIHEGFSGQAPTGNSKALWEWARDQGDGFRLSATTILAMANAYEADDDLPGLTASMVELKDRHWRRLPTLLDDSRNAMLGELLRGFREYFR